MKEHSLKGRKSNNPNGRPKGTPNKVGMVAREMIAGFVEGKLQNIESLYNQLEPKDQLKCITDLMKYAIPSLSSVDLTANVDGNMQTKIVVEYRKQEQD